MQCLRPALWNEKCQKLYTFARTYCTPKGLKPKHFVIVSRSTCIFENLALEEWLYEKTDLEKKSILLLWRNKPVIVCGRHQNPWLESNVSEAASRNIDIARRRSGGGTVYHDEGNLNCSFIMHRRLYNRKSNLELVVRALCARWNLNLEVNCREDIVLDGLYKVSGTASRIAGNKTYHHFTLLHSVDIAQLQLLLQSPMVRMNSRATLSVTSPVVNLSDAIPQASDMNFDSLVDAISHAFLVESENQAVTWVDPGSETMFPGLSSIVQQLQDWEWVFGKTPPFTISRKYVKNISDRKYVLELTISINKGRIQEVIGNLDSHEYHKMLLGRVSPKLTGTRLKKDELLLCLADLHNFCASLCADKEDVIVTDWIMNCLQSSLFF